MDIALFATAATLSVYIPRYVLFDRGGRGDSSYHFGRHYDHRYLLDICKAPIQTMQESSMAIAVGLSMSMFSLSLLEAAAVPSSPIAGLLLIITRQQEDDGGSLPKHSRGLFTIAYLYWLVLWTTCIAILVVFPFVTGVSLTDSIQSVCFAGTSSGTEKTSRGDSGDDGDDKKMKSRKWKKQHAWESSPWWIRLPVSLICIVTKNGVLAIKRAVHCKAPSKSNSALVSSRKVLPGTSDIRENASIDTDMLRRAESGESVDHDSSKAFAPTSLSQSIYSHGKHQSSVVWRLVGGIIGVGVVGICASTVGSLVVTRTNQSSDTGLLSTFVSWLCAVGLLISSLLNGFGSVSMPYTCLAGLFLTPIQPKEIQTQEFELLSLQETLARKVKTLQDQKIMLAASNVASSSYSANLSMSIFPSNNSTGHRPTFGMLVNDHQKDNALSQEAKIIEIDFLRTLCIDREADIDDLRYSQMMATQARTISGKVRSYIGLVFSILLLVRLFSAIVSIWNSYTRHKVAQGDIVTKIIVWLSGYDLVSEADTIMISQAISLLVTTILTFSQTRTFFRAMKVLQRQSSKVSKICPFNILGSRIPSGSSSRMNEVSPNTFGQNVWSQTIAGATGCYFLSCVFVIKMMLPVEFCKDFANAMGGMDMFTIHMSTVNIVFTFSACISIIILALLFGIQRQNNLRHHRSITNTAMVVPNKIADAV